MAPYRLFRIADDLADAFSEQDETLELEEGGHTYYRATTFFYEQAIQYLLRLDPEDDHRRLELLRAIQRKYDYEGRKGHADDFFATHKRYASYYTDAPDSARVFLSGWLDRLMVESGSPNGANLDAIVAPAAGDARLCKLWTDYKDASEALANTWSASRHPNLAKGRALADAITSRRECGGVAQPVDAVAQPHSG